MPEETVTQNAAETARPVTEMLPKQLWSDPIGYIQDHQDVITGVCFDIIMAIVILVVGWMIAKFFAKISSSLMNKAKVEPTISKFVANIIKYAILVFAVTAALSQLGIQTASFVAIIGAASFAVAMSLQGSLSNFAAGVLLLIFRPIKVGEFVDVAGQQGVVDEITIFTTTLTTLDNKVVIIPNSAVSAGTITNYSRLEKRRVDFVFHVEYGSDLKKVTDVLTKTFESDPRVIKEDGITVVVGELNTSAVDFICRAWVKNADYWDVFFDSNANVYNNLRAAGVGIPYQTFTVINKK